MPKPLASRERISNVRSPKKLCVIATEDSCTGAVLYFESLRKRFSTNCAFKIERIIKSKGGKSSPKHVLNNIKPSRYDRSIDSCWIVCDVDSWKNSMIEDTISECKRLSIKHAFSNPCFEIWILYHSHAVPKKFNTSKECKEKGNEFMKDKGYDYIFSDEQIKNALMHAKNADSEEKDWPLEQGSHVFKLIQFLQIV
jgi:hypothetical protein